MAQHNHTPASHFSYRSQLPVSHTAQNIPSSPPHRVPPSTSSVSLSFAPAGTVHKLWGANATDHTTPGHGRHIRSSRTWTSSSGERGILSDTDQVDDRSPFIHEYNRLAKKHGVRLLIVEDFEPSHRQNAALRTPQKRRWFLRLLYPSPTANPSSISQSQPPPPPRPMAHHKRSVSDLAHHLVHAHREPPKTVDIQSMVRLSGKSVLYLPQDYAPYSLVLPTCIRATAQHIAQNATTRGIFRVPGSVKIVNALFDYYCYMGTGGANIASTVRCANLPIHIQASVHDIASTFKRFISVLPGGILGSLSVFDALVAIRSQLHGDPEFTRTRQTKVRARLIALALATIKSQFRRDLLCAVFGLLSFIGRIAETVPREDASGRPLPTADLIGYTALGIVFGPLLVGDLLDKYTMKLATPDSGLLLFPLSPQKLRSSRQRFNTTKGKRSDPLPVDKILVSNSITEMLIANWRDIVRQLKSLGVNHHKDRSSINITPHQSQVSSLDSPQNDEKPSLSNVGEEKKSHSNSPTPDRPSPPQEASSIRPSVSEIRPTVSETRPSVSEVANNRGAVRAMAAMFDQNDQPRPPSTKSRTKSRGPSMTLPSEELREARREIQMWKERAEGAERRVKVFEKFTARLKCIREATAVADQRTPALPKDKEQSSRTRVDTHDTTKDGTDSDQHVRILKARRTTCPSQRRVSEVEKRFGSDRVCCSGHEEGQTMAKPGGCGGR